MSIGNLELAAAEVVLGVLTGPDLPAVCEKAVVEGVDSRSLRMLAGLEGAAYDPWEVEPLWHATLRELAVSVPTTEDAARIVIEDAAVRFLRGVLAPKDALRRVVRDAYYGSGAHERDKQIAGDSLGLGRLVGLYHECAEVGEAWSRSAEELDRDLVEELHAVLARGARIGARRRA